MQFTLLLSLVLLVASRATPAPSTAEKDVPHLVRLNGHERSSARCCGQDAALLACWPALVDPAALTSPQIRLPGGLSLGLASTVPAGGPHRHGYHFTNLAAGAEAVFTYSPTTGGLHGSLLSAAAAGRTFVLEFCGGEDGHVWKEWNTAAFGEDVGLKSMLKANKDLEAVAAAQRVRGAADNTTMATYSVKVYFTPEFALETADIEGFVSQAIAETNQGYANSQVPITIELFCIEPATINDYPDSHTMLEHFRDMKGKNNYHDLRDSADAAALLAMDIGSSCGIAYVDTTASGHTLSVTEKKCTVGYFSFGHEIGHNYGCKHNPEESTNEAYPYGHGHLIEGGYRTILAYTAEGHQTRANYYSNPSIKLPATGTPTGVEGLSNNAAVLLLNRFSMEALGDESSECVWKGLNV